MNKDYQELLESLNIIPKKHELYVQALTHPSYENEKKTDLGDYQRLEFMGDAVIQLIITKYIYNNYLEMQEGDMSLLRSNLVREETLAEIARLINLGDYILLGVGEEKSNGRERPSLLCDVFESLIAATYLDLGFSHATRVVIAQYRKLIDDEGMDCFLKLKDNKTKLQELMQADTKRTLEYVTKGVQGPANQPEFFVDVMMDKMILGSGVGHSKKAAEQDAAKNALSKMATIKK